MEQVSILKLKIRALFLYLIMSLLIFSTAYFIWVVAYYPYTRQNMYEYLEASNVLAFQEIEGALVYISEIERGYLVGTFIPSLVLNRYRLETYQEFGYSFVTAVQGRFRYFVLETDRSTIFYTVGSTYRVHAIHIIGSITFVISFMLLFATTNKVYLKKRAKHR